MTKYRSQIVTAIALSFLACVIGFNTSRTAQGQGGTNSSSADAEALSQTVKNQEDEIATLKTTLEELKKIVETNAHKSLERDKALKGLADTHSEKFNTHEERFKRVIDQLGNHNKTHGLYDQGLTGHNKRLIELERKLQAIEQFLRRRNQ